jgi:hypothetical protein
MEGARELRAVEANSCPYNRKKATMGQRDVGIMNNEL